MKIFKFFPLWGRLFRAGLVGGLFGTFKHLDIQDYAEDSRIIRHAAKVNELYLDEVRRNNENLAIILNNSTFIIKQAFADLEFNGEVKVLFAPPSLQSKDEYINAGCLSYIDEDGKSAAFIELASYPTEIQDEEAFYRKIYATGGHEAVHALHRHQLVKATLVGMIVGFTPFFGIVFLDQIECQLNKLGEIDADLYSAFKLGTAFDHREDLIRASKNRTGKTDSNGDENTHPLLQTRINYLQMFGMIFGSEPRKLLQNETYKQMVRGNKKF